MNSDDVCLLYGILFAVAGFTIFYAGVASLEEWRGKKDHCGLDEKILFGSRDEYREARLEIFRLRRQRWAEAPRVRLVVYAGLLLMICGAICFWMR